MGNTNQKMKDFVNQYLVDSQNPDPPPIIHQQYDKANAETLISRNGANSANNYKSDLNTAKYNMEKNYKTFLTQYGQYSNQLLEHPTGRIITKDGKEVKDTIQYPFTDLFKDFPDKPSS
jgi:hypothetical protein